jgi:hypothetical protein
MAGGEIRIRQTCTPPNSPILTIGALDLRAAGTDPNWRVTVPATLKPDVYPLKWKCGSVDASKELPQLAIVEVLPVSPRVVAVSNFMRDQRVARVASESRTPKDARDQLKDVLRVKVANLEPWRQLQGNAPLQLHLYLAGTELKTVVAEATSKDPGDGPEISALRINLDLDDKNADNRRAWVQALKAAIARSDRRIELTLGPPGAPFQSDTWIELDVFPSYTWAVALFLGLTALAIIVLGRKSNLLRDSNGSATPPYSLAKHQMAIWFVVVVGSYLYVWLITGTFSSISTTALTLIGISGATGLVAVTMDNSKREQATKDRLARQAEHDAIDAALNGSAGLRAQLAALPAGAPAAATLQTDILSRETRLNELRGLLAAPAAGPAVGRQWYLDLLSDDSGVSFHRLQMAIWTLVLAMVFVRAVIADILMPDFDVTLLGLLGISSGTYLGFKFPEK